MPWQAWAVWAAVGGGMEVYALVTGSGPLTHWFFRLAENDWARAVVTAFFAWWVYHWYVEPRMFPGLRGPGPDDIGVGLLAGILAFFGQRKKGAVAGPGPAMSITLGEPTVDERIREIEDRLNALEAG